ncbi:acyltransferase family protein [Thiobacillus sp.]
MTYNLNLLRAIGILLVTNSHFDMLYPDPRLGTGGALGNAFFFALSGYGLAHSYRNRGRGFMNWYWRRITRIFPSVWIVALLTLTYLGLWGDATPTTLFAEFVWPTRHWFISAIMLFYIGFFLLLAVGRKLAFEVVAGLLLIPYVIGYIGFIDLSTWSIESGYFKWIFYGQLMLLGAVVANRDDWIVVGNLRLEALTLVTLFVSYFGVKLLMSATGFWDVQFVIHLLTLPILLLAFRVSAAKPMQVWAERSRVGRVAGFISVIALEMYLAQHLFHTDPWLRSLPFPLGAILALAGVVLLSMGVLRLSNLIRSGLERRGAAARMAPESKS